jgi:iron complex transport system substrate-binding protein
MIREIGRAAGIADRADALVAELQARLDRVRARASGRPRRRVLIVVSRSAGGLSDLVAVGRGSYLHELVGVAGGVNVLDDPGLPRKLDRQIPNQRSQVFSPRGAGQSDTALARRSLASYPRISMETVIRLAPDVIVDAADMGDTVEEHVRRRPVTEALWKRQTSVAAARTGGVHAVTSDAFVVPGPRMVEAAETLAGWLRDR